MVEFQAQSGTHTLVDNEDWNSLLDHGLEKTASYIIRKNGSYYEAIQGGTNTGAGTIAFGGSGNAGSIDGTKATSVEQACVDAIETAGAGSLLKKAAVYSATDEIELPNAIPIRIMGEVSASKYGLTKGTIMQAANAIDSFYVGAGAGGANRCLATFENLYLDGNGGNATVGLELVNTGGQDRSKFLTNVEIDDCITGFYLKDTVGGSIDTLYCHDCTTGALFDGATASSVTGLSINALCTEGNDYGTVLRGSVQGNSFYNLISEGNLYNELRLESIQGGAVAENVFYNAWFEKTSVEGTYKGIYLTTYGVLTSGTTVRGTIFDCCKWENAADLYIDAARETVVRDHIPENITIIDSAGDKYVGPNYITGAKDEFATYTYTDASTKMIVDVNGLGYTRGADTTAGGPPPWIEITHGLWKAPVWCQVSFGADWTFDGWWWVNTSATKTRIYITNDAYSVNYRLGTF
jgi:hypothetical protein